MKKSSSRKSTLKSIKNALVYVSKSAIHGRGVFATNEIKRGQTIGTFEWIETRRDGKFVLWVEQDDGSHVGCRGINEMRYMNHSKHANAEFDDFDVVATARIKADEEVFIDYGW